MLIGKHKKFAIILVLVVSVCLAAQEENPAEKKDEDKKIRDNDRVWEQVIPVYTFSSRRTNLFDLGLLKGTVREGPGGTSALDLSIRLKSLVTNVSFSFYIRPTIYGSPGMDGFLLPRTSMNKNPVTGWYYWDF